MILQIHDELLFEGLQKRWMNYLNGYEEMEGAMKLSIPSRVEELVKIGMRFINETSITLKGIVKFLMIKQF